MRAQTTLPMVKPLMDTISNNSVPTYLCVDEGSQKRRVLAELPAAEGCLISSGAWLLARRREGTWRMRGRDCRTGRRRGDCLYYDFAIWHYEMSMATALHRWVRLRGYTK
jgi:hypothetical protein